MRVLLIQQPLLLQELFMVNLPILFGLQEVQEKYIIMEVILVLEQIPQDQN